MNKYIGPWKHWKYSKRNHGNYYLIWKFEIELHELSTACNNATFRIEILLKEYA